MTNIFNIEFQKAKTVFNFSKHRYMKSLLVILMLVLIMEGILYATGFNLYLDSRIAKFMNDHFKDDLIYLHQICRMIRMILFPKTF